RNLQENQITDLSSIATSGIGHVYNLGYLQRNRFTFSLDAYIQVCTSSTNV
ncbi:unnamed protein product, partial [Pocillopora meandrina]